MNRNWRTIDAMESKLCRSAPTFITQQAWFALYAGVR